MTEDRDLFLPITIVVALAVIAIGVWAALRNYDECRATPHTAFYCLTHGG